jgi:adenylyltransferase/sulfurtransferase
MPEKNLTSDELQRYSRHILMPEFGVEGQRRLKAASVVIIGAGGLGSPAAFYLAAAGIGRIGLVDFDVVGLTNLQRQILYSDNDLGKAKTSVAKDRLTAINPHLVIEIHQTELTSLNALEILKNYDIILDASDNFSTRYLVSDASVILKKPNVYGSIIKFDGQVGVFDSARGPCYRCLFPSPPPANLVPNCSQAGVLGVLPGIIGTLQALEVIKLATGIGEALIGRLVIFDGMKSVFNEIAISKDPDCPSCGRRAPIHTLTSYENYCAPTSNSAESHSSANFEISVDELEQKLDRGDKLFLLDVREPEEREICNIGGHLIPLVEISARLSEIDREAEVIVYCKSGGRSAVAVEILRNAGFNSVKNLTGGIDAWAERIDQSLPRY